MALIRNVTIVANVIIKIVLLRPHVRDILHSSRLFAFISEANVLLYLLFHIDMASEKI